MHPLNFFGWTAVSALLLLMASARAKDAHSRADLALAAPLLVAGLMLTNLVLGVVVLLTPRTVDAQLAGLDPQFAASFQHFTFSHPVWHIALGTVYLILPLWMAVTILMAPDRQRLGKMLVLAAVLAVPIYLLIPATGPRWIHTANAPRNAFPSLHVAWALILCYQTPRMFKWAAALLVIGTAVATVGLGEHYLVDIVAAVPLTFATIRVTRPLPQRRTSFLLGRFSLENTTYPIADNRHLMAVNLDGKLKPHPARTDPSGAPIH